MKHRVSIVVLASVLCAGSGCFTVGNNFPSRPVRKIEKSVTTKPEIEKLFGDPFRKGLDDGYESWTYVYNRWNLFSTTRSKDLYVVFNRDGTVRSYTYNSNLEEE